MVIVLGFFSLLLAAFTVYSAATTENYRQLRLEEVAKTVAFESERVGKTIAEMERNALDLALAGRQFYMGGDYSGALGESVVVGNFQAFPAAVGGGIWFEPYALIENERRICFYAFFDPDYGSVHYDPEFQSEAYDYHTQVWYTGIKEHLTGEYSTVWTAPYYENIGSNSLMTTVGAGIYNEAGNFIGLSTVDWKIQSVVDRLSAIKPTANSFVLLASPRDDYIISNTYAGAGGGAADPLHSLSWYEQVRYSSGGSVDTGEFTLQGIEYISFSRLFDNGWLFSIQIPAQEIFAAIEKRNRQFSQIIAATSLALLSLVFYLVSRLVNRPLRKLTSGVTELGGGNLEKQIDISSRDEIGMLAKSFNKMTVDLKSSIEQNARERAEKERISAELNVARSIQASMLPNIFPPYPHRREFDIYATMLPAKEVGGDFYDFFLVGDNRLAVIIADVSGKGVPAALFMVIAKTLLKNNASAGQSPREVFETVNALLCDNNEAGMFVTVFMGYWEIDSGRFAYVNAGHNPPLLKRAGGDYEFLRSRPCLVLAGMEGTRYTEQELTLNPGDALFLYTDGVTEAMNESGELFAEARLKDTLRQHQDDRLAVQVAKVKAALDAFAGSAEQADDITMLALRINA